MRTATLFTLSSSTSRRLPPTTTTILMRWDTKVHRTTQRKCGAKVGSLKSRTTQTNSRSLLYTTIMENSSRRISSQGRRISIISRSTSTKGHSSLGRAPTSSKVLLTNNNSNRHTVPIEQAGWLLENKPPSRLIHRWTKMNNTQVWSTMERLLKMN